METLDIFRDNIPGQEKYTQRPTAKGVIINSENKIALMPGLPGGGVETGESFEDALHRECMEELGMTIEIVEPLGFIEQYRDALKRHYIIQGFFCKMVGELTNPTSTDPDDIKKNHQEKLQWYTIEDAITFTKMRIETLEQGISRDDYDVSRKDDYFQSRIYNAKTVLVFLETVKNKFLK